LSSLAALLLFPPAGARCGFFLFCLSRNTASISTSTQAAMAAMTMPATAPPDSVAAAAAPAESEGASVAPKHSGTDVAGSCTSDRHVSRQGVKRGSANSPPIQRTTWKVRLLFPRKSTDTAPGPMAEAHTAEVPLKVMATCTVEALALEGSNLHMDPGASTGAPGPLRDTDTTAEVASTH
jgi:hypothetical protein